MTYTPCCVSQMPSQSWQGSMGLPRAFPSQGFCVVFQPSWDMPAPAAESEELCSMASPAFLGVWACRKANMGSKVCLPSQQQGLGKILILHGLDAFGGTPGRSGVSWPGFARVNAGQIMESWDGWVGKDLKGHPVPSPAFPFSQPGSRVFSLSFPRWASSL